jgi:hypothetical protein
MIETMRRRIATALSAVAVFVLLSAAVSGSAGAAGGSETQRQTLLTLAVRLTNNELRYLHTTWWDATYHYETAMGLEVALPDTPLDCEGTIRPQAEALCATAMMLTTGKYDAARVGVSRSEALRRVKAWSNALALSYEKEGWGRGWQSALWVYYWSYGSDQVWRSIPKGTQVRITAAVANEANHLLTLPPLFYADAAGNIVYPGDSKAEENAWNAALLYLAAKRYPTNANAAKWASQARWYMLAAFATPSQVGTDPRITGSNLNVDGTVTNHGFLNIDYMACHAEFAMKARIIARQTRSTVPREFSNNFSLIWRALTKVAFEGGTIYRTNENGRPCADVYYPEGYSYSEFRRFNLAQTDVEVFLQGFDKQAFAWAKAHLQYVLDQQARHDDGHVFAPGEDSNPGDEPFCAVTGAEMVSRLYYR